jgi:succinoglycan biosynthesis protein ExoM
MAFHESKQFAKTTQEQAAAHPSPHIVVCVCSYKRDLMLKRCLNGLAKQKTDDQFKFSIVVADNDAAKSAEAVVAEFARRSEIPIRYCIEPRQNIALARNKAVEEAEGDYIVFIDDDEFPDEDWLVRLYAACSEYKVDGVFGPVIRHFDETPPRWLVDGNFYQRSSLPTGQQVPWSRATTCNVLVRSSLLKQCAQPFRPEFRSGEDQDFFRRMMEKGHTFIWCNEAVAHEVIPPVRWSRKFMIRRALLSGAMSAAHPTFGPLEFCKSTAMTLVYLLALPFAQILGHHRFVSCSVKLFYHLGRVLRSAGFNPVRDAYVTE